MKIRTLAVIALLLASSISLAYADEAEKPSGEFSGTLTMASDYMLRGITQNNEHPALQGSFDYAHASGLYAGLWASNVDFKDGGVTSLETDIYGGIKFPLSGFNIDLGGIGYVYPGQHQNINHYDYIEGKAAANKSFGFADMTAQVNYSPNFFAGSGHATYINLNGTAPVAKSGFNFLGSAGHQWIQNNTRFGVPDYTDWSLGVGYSLHGFDLALKYIDTNLGKASCADGCEPRVVFSVTRAFK